MGPADNAARATVGEMSDVASTDLTGVQEELIRAIYETGTPTVVVLINGRPLSTRWTAEHVPAILEAWEPGERGGEAIAEVLFGDQNPSGRLPVTIPRHAGQLPVFYNAKPAHEYVRRHTGGYVDMDTTPLYAFGHGLSYTTFRYSNLRVEPAQIRPGGRAQISVDIENTGGRAGEEVAQLYIRDVLATVTTPVQQLRGFRKVALEPGEVKTVTFTLAPEDLALLDRDMHWVVEPGTFEIMVGGSSASIALRGALEVMG